MSNYIDSKVVRIFFGLGFYNLEFEFVWCSAVEEGLGQHRT
jgi:hypothetical protein